jgi:hypothetical protein
LCSDDDDDKNPSSGDEIHVSYYRTQDCGTIYTDGTLDDEYCESAHHQQFFCEMI